MRDGLKRSLASVFERLFALETFGIKLGLENIARLCEGLDHPERAFASVHVAGTNGKGSVAAMVHAALVSAGVRSARYTSPHLSDITERFVVGRDAVERDTLAAAVDRVLACADRLQSAGTLRVTPTFFEVTTAAAFELFRSAGVEVAVVEVGLGGRFDATNVVAPIAGAITSIGMDHHQHLGNTLEQIAFEKAGIIKPGLPVVVGPLPPPAHAVIREIAAARGAQLIDATATRALDVRMIDGAARLDVTTGTRHYGPVSLGLRGGHQVPNALVAIALLEAVESRGVPMTPEAVASGLAAPDWPARLELFALENGRRVLLDAAHNQDGAAALADYLREWHPERPPLVLGVMQDKDVDVMLRTLLPAVSAVLATAAPSTRAMPAAELARRAAAVAADTGQQIPITAVEDPEEALRVALEGAPLVCVAGSIFLAGPVRDVLVRRAMLR
jgi:dihydrofolate synthase / folylpolyglutamate synthase